MSIEVLPGQPEVSARLFLSRSKLTRLSGAYEYPHLIVPVSSKTPGTAAGTSYNGVVDSTTSSIFNFDIPTSDAGKTCSLIFLFPTQAQLTTSSFTFSGNGGIDFSMLKGVATQSTTYNNAPAVKTDYGVTVVAPGNSYTIATFPCPSGQAVSYELKASGNTQLTYFQDYSKFRTWPLNSIHTYHRLRSVSNRTLHCPMLNILTHAGGLFHIRKGLTAKRVE